MERWLFKLDVRAIDLAPYEFEREIEAEKLEDTLDTAAVMMPSGDEWADAVITSMTLTIDQLPS